jgi:hypothetical protein
MESKNKTTDIITENSRKDSKLKDKIKLKDQ